jgi:tRNA uridine 5-carbamoylmethylation protein Kti12
MNYIKGFRYQLYCVARAISTPHCVVCIEMIAKNSQVIELMEI